MIIVMQKSAPKKKIEHVLQKIKEKKLTPIPLYGTERTVIAIIGDERTLEIDSLRAFPGVENVMPVLKPYQLAARDTKFETSKIKIFKNIMIGGEKIQVITGPCSIESLEIQLETCQKCQKAGSAIQRGGAYKPRTSPYAFQGMGEEGLKIMETVKTKTGMPICTEVMDPRFVSLVAKHADIIQIGTRNMQNFSLLKEVGRTDKPVLLKRGMSATIDELLMAAEYIMSEGNTNVILCERGIRTFETATRNTLDISAIPVLKKLTHLPIVVDPSHAAGDRDLVPALSKAAIAAGADGLLIEVHPDPENATSDAKQTMSIEQFSTLMKELKPIAAAVGRTI
jgi:3-deoxy-7-phosphoheptulonate synthase